MRKILIFLFIFLISFSFASDKWSITTLESRVQTNFAISNEQESVSVYFGCENGDIYSVNINNGKINWKYSIGSFIGDDLIIINSTVITYSGNTLYFFDSKNGTLKNQYSFTSSVYGISSELKDDFIYATTQDAIYAISKDAFIVWQNNINCKKTRPVVDDYFVYTRCNDFIYSLDKLQGTTKWKSYTGNPIYINGGELRLFVSTADNNMKTLDITEGKERWSYSAEGWITQIKDNNGAVFFISNDYYVYVLDAGSGKLLWKKYIGDMTTFDVNDDVILVGSKNNKIYGLNRETGDEEFILFVSHWPENIEIYENQNLNQNLVIYSTLDSKVFATYIDQVCTFKEPEERGIIGSAEFLLTGTTYSMNDSIQTVEIGIDADYKRAQGIENWSVYLDPYSYSDGVLTISCRLYPYEDREDTTRRLIKSPQGTLIEDMDIQYDPQTDVNQQTTITAQNKYNRPIKGTTALYDGDEYPADDNGYITISFDSPGIKTIQIERKGYKTETIQIQVGAEEDYTLFYLVGIVILLIIAFIIIKKLRK